MSSMTLPVHADTATAGVPSTRCADAGPACAVDPELMFPLQESLQPGLRTTGEQRALAVCAGCPVLVACRQAVLDTLDSAPMPYGVAGGLTREERRAIRAHRRDLIADPARPAARLAGRLTAAAIETAIGRQAVEDAEHLTDEAGSEAGIEHSLEDSAGGGAGAGPEVGLVVVDVLDEHVAAAIAAHPQVTDAVDPATVRGLVEGDGPAWASRWEVALAAIVLLARGLTPTAAARALGEEYAQLKRWRDRAETGEALVAGERGTIQLRRPARLVGPQPPATQRPGREARTRGAA